MAAVLYTVRATCKDLHQCGRYLSWLAPSHVEAVKEAGASGVRIMLYRGEQPGELPYVETQYSFPSRKAFDAYVRDHAPALRADGAKHFPPESGVVFERRLGEICYES